MYRPPPTTHSTAWARGLLVVCLLGTAVAQARNAASAGLAGIRATHVTRPAAGFADSWSRIVRRTGQLRTRPSSAGLRRGDRSLSFRRPGPQVPSAVGSAQETREAQGPLRDDPPTVTIGTRYRGLDRKDHFTLNPLAFYGTPPDTMGAMGPDHFVELLGSGIAIFSREGVRLGQASLDAFFSFGIGGQTYPRDGAIDPTVRFDAKTGRWFATALELNGGHENHVILAVSRTSDPTGAWDKHLLPMGLASTETVEFFSSAPTLGLDGNGVYVGLNIFGFDRSTGGFVGFTSNFAATPLEPLVDDPPGRGPVFQFADMPDWYSPYPATSMDPTAPSDPTWILAADWETWGILHYRRLFWNDGVPTLSDRATFELPPYGIPVNAPAAGTQSAPVEVNDDRPAAPVLRNGRLWAVRQVGVAANGKVNVAPDGSSDADRSGCEWFEIDTSGASLTLLQTARVWDPAASDPRFYYYPSIMVSGQGHVVMSFSGSKASEFIGAYYCTRLSSDLANNMSAVTLLYPGEGPYDLPVPGGDGQPRQVWGSTSSVSLDPRDDMTFWTVQEHAGVPAPVTLGASASNWSTVVAQLRAPAPQLSSTTGIVFQGQRGAEVQLSGSGFYQSPDAWFPWYDVYPGSDFWPEPLRVQIVGIAAEDAWVSDVRFVDESRVTIRVDALPDAQSGLRDLVLHNPDGQYTVLEDAFQIQAPPPGTVQVPRRLDFGSARVGRPKTRALTVKNASKTQSLLVSLVETSGPFFVEDSSSLLLEPGAKGQIEITLFSTASGTAKGSAVLSTSDPDHPTVKVSLSAKVRRSGGTGAEG